MTRRIFLGLSLVWACAGQEEAPPSDTTRAVESTCTAPYQTPPYQAPADDSVAFESILEAAGYGSAGNSNWVDIAAGNFCGGIEKELVLIKNQHSNFSILRGPAPHAVGSGDISSDPDHPWRGAAAADLDGDGFAEIVAVRKVTANGVPDVIVAKVDAASCSVSQVASKAVGTPGNSEWLDVAIGNFMDDTAKEIALLKADHSNFIILSYQGGALTTRYASDLGTDASMPWKAIAAANLDGAGRDELVAARRATQGSSAKTVLGYRWNANLGQFVEVASSTVGNTGNSMWTDATGGDFNGDTVDSVVLVKDAHSMFILLDLPAGSSTLVHRTSSDLDWEPGKPVQPLRGVTAVDWLRGDSGAHELLAARTPQGNYRTDLFVLGNDHHRASRDTGLAHTEAQYAKDRLDGTSASIDELVTLLGRTHTTTFNFLVHGTDGQSYLNLVEFLEATQTTCIDGRQLRVWVTLVSPGLWSDDCEEPNAPPDCEKACSIPVNSPLTPFNDLVDFPAADRGDDNPSEVRRCANYRAWASLVGRLAERYPHLLALNIDDFTHAIDDPFDEETVAEMESNMRRRAPWLNFVPTVYYDEGNRWVGSLWPDLFLTLDSILFYFRGEREITGASNNPCNNSSGCDFDADACPYRCLASPLPGSSALCAEETIPDAHWEIDDMAGLLARGRKMQVGVYFQGHSTCGTPTPQYDLHLSQTLLDQPEVDGLTVYTTRWYPVKNLCTVITSDKYCVAQYLFANY